METKFTIPADFSKDGPLKIRELEEKYPGNKVREVFGNMSGSKWSSGHGYLPKQNFAKNLTELETYIKLLSDIDCDFNYTFNAEYLENKDITSSGLMEIESFMKELIGIGVKRVTVASPFLIKYIRERLPQLKVTVSSITNVDSVIRAKAVDEYGVDTIVYGEDITRNLGMLHSIKNNINASTEIIVNSKCTFNCVYRVFHYASVNAQCNLSDLQYNYGRNCALERMKDPVSYIKSLWIRPEDIGIYENYGVDLFKIIGREQLNHIDLYRMVEKYFSRSFNGNLLDLIFGFDTSIEHYYIDNKKLDGFMDKFISEPFSCLAKCETGQCNYCEYYLNKSKKRD